MRATTGKGERVAESEPTQDQHTAASSQAQAQIDAVLKELAERTAQVREQQASALSVTGRASSQDGTVRATVDATGVVTALDFASSVFDRSTPDKLARTVVATIQAAAAQARGEMSENLAAARAPQEGVLAAAAQGSRGLGIQVGVPEVPRTVTDPTGEQDGWQEPQPQVRENDPYAAPPADPEPEPAPPAPAPAARAPRTPRGAADAESSYDEQNPW
jgi:DNA-binding protein YbaB